MYRIDYKRSESYAPCEIYFQWINIWEFLSSLNFCAELLNTHKVNKFNKNVLFQKEKKNENFHLIF